MDWTAILDAFERNLDAQWSALDRNAPHEAPSFTPPEPTQPLPPELTERATALVWRCRALEDALSAALAKTTEELERPAPATAPAQPVYFDSRV